MGEDSKLVGKIWNGLPKRCVGALCLPCLEQKLLQSPNDSEQTLEQSPFTRDPSEDGCIQVWLFLCHVITLFTTLWLSCHNVY